MLLLRQPLDTFNLRFSPAGLQVLLKEGVALIGDGLINMFKADGQPDPSKVRGFAGMLIAARDYRARYPKALLVSVDTKLARLWLRLADTGERCDLLGLRSEEGVLVVDAIEVKTTGTGTVAEAEVDRAKNQLRSTLAAIQSGLREDEQSSPLVAPRQEMLKEVFVSGCQSLSATTEDRTRWAKWLQTLFGETEDKSDSELRGTVYMVELGNNASSDEEPICEQPPDIFVYRIREARIQDLISEGPTPLGRGANGSSTELPKSSKYSHEQTPPTPIFPKHDSTQIAENDRVTTPGLSTKQRTKVVEEGDLDLGMRFIVGDSLSAGDLKPFYLHPSNTKLNQLNIGVVGDLGTGKTQLTKALIYQFVNSADFNRGHTPKFLIFDYKQDYTKSDFVDAVGAKVVRPYQIPLNIFDFHVTGSRVVAARLGRVKFLNRHFTENLWRHWTATAK